jgi:hypothetical protein
MYQRTKHPHTRQNKDAGYHYEPFRTLDPSLPKMPYRRRHGEFKSTLHWGQRKLFLVELEFLTMYASEADIVLYAGAAPGIHIPYLSSLFPLVKFVLYDPNEFLIEPSDTIEIHREYFINDTARLYAGRTNVLFISDIRTVNPTIHLPAEIELGIEGDHIAQRMWYEIINPKKTMLKFRAPWLVPHVKQEDKYIPSVHEAKDKVYKWVTAGGEEYKYLTGDLYIQPWGPQTTTEMRLHVDHYDEKTGPITSVYNNTEIEQQLFYFNCKSRPSLYKHNVSGNGIDHCYDCYTEVTILKKYITKYSNIEGVSLAKQTSSMSYQLSKALGTRRLNHAQPNKY